MKRRKYIKSEINTSVYLLWSVDSVKVKSIVAGKPNVNGHPLIQATNVNLNFKKKKNI